MKVYQLKYSPKRFKAFQLDILSLAEQLGDEGLLPLLMEFPLTNEPLLQHWGRVSDKFTPLSSTSVEISDISLWGHTSLILNEKAYKSLNEYLKGEGEFLPVIADGEEMQIFNCLSFGKEDASQCLKKYLDGYEDGLETLVFDEADVANRFLFKSKMQGCGALYCSSLFKSLCSEFGIQGLRFDEGLLDPF
ncbi:hypothetical protein BTJ40_18150 [Microbulbifer sp. A4B17]|uniref:hypothetical protein n=1 Tax=Microbulbifer sp. A4B17 TaxID=359370 RepID=UPI000D52D1E3|nr:hypothetical protein [Microbulbifer sp. A4B17]AWF82574.1 hypothetical protein BTJ40_18150 [Microbulbifer sp. A4B17]